MANETEGAPGEQGFLKSATAGCLNPPAQLSHLLGLFQLPYDDPARIEERHKLFRGLDWIFL